MGCDHGNWTDAGIALEAARWTWWPPSATVVEDERRLLVHVPVPPARSVVHRSSVPDARRARDLIWETLAEARAAGSAELVWHTNGATEPANTGELLSERGFEPAEDLEVLAFDLGDGPEPTLPGLGIPAGVMVEQARNVDSIRQMYAIKAEVFSSTGSAEEISALAGDLERPAGTGESLALGFLASVDGEPAASAGMQVIGGVARLWGGGTLERLRGRGAYKALVAERCRVAHAHGATLALTRARTGTAGPILARAGFRKAGAERRYALRISGGPDLP